MNKTLLANHSQHCCMLSPFAHLVAYYCILFAACCLELLNYAKLDTGQTLG